MDGDNEIFDSRSGGNTVTDIPDNAKIEVHYDYSISDEYEYSPGDYIEFEFPEIMKFEEKITDLVSGDENTAGEMHLKDSTATIIFSELASRARGGFTITGTYDENAMEGGKTVEIELAYGGVIYIKKTPPVVDDTIDIEKDAEYIVKPGGDEILWTITIATPSAISTGSSISIVDTFSLNQQYVADTFKVNGVPVTTPVSITTTDLVHKFSYEIPDLKTSQIITYKTKPIVDVFSKENTNNKTVIFDNVVRLYVDGAYNNEADAEVEFNWIAKSGNVVTEDGIRKIKWEITVTNEDGMLTGKNPKIIDTIDENLSLDGDVILKLYNDKGTEISTSTNQHTYDGKKLTHLLGNDYFKTAKLTYYIEVKIIDDGDAVNNESIKFENTAYLEWDDSGEGKKYGKPSDGDSVSIGKGLISKRGSFNSYYINGDNEVILWTVEINRNNITMTDVVFKDEIPQGLEYVEGSFAVDAVTKTAITTGSSISYNLGDINKKTTITYETRILEDNKDLFLNGSVPFKNAAEIEYTYNNKEYTAKDNITQSITTQVINKSAVNNGGIVYNYSDRTITWKIVINRNKMPLANAVFTDTLPDGMTYVEDSFQVLLDDEDVTDEDEFDIDEEGKVITYKFPNNIENQYIIIFTTEAEESFLSEEENLNKDELPFENNSTLTSTFDGAELTRNSKATVKVKNNVIKKDGEVLGERKDSIKWTVPINAAKIYLEDIVITDTLQDHLEYNPVTGKLYKAEVNHATGVLDKVKVDGKDVEVHSEDYKITRSGQEITLEIFKKGTDAYIFEFETDVLIGYINKVENTVMFNGSGLGASDTKDIGSIRVNEDGAWELGVVQSVGV